MPRAKVAPKAKPEEAPKVPEPVPYKKRSKADLLELCRRRRLPHSKKTLKEDLVARLENDDLDVLPETPDMTRFPLFKLPLETRCNIYELVFASDQDVCVSIDEGSDEYEEYPVTYHSTDPTLRHDLVDMNAIQLFIPAYQTAYMGKWPSKVKKLIHTRRFALLRVCWQIYLEARDRVYSAVTVRFDLTASTFGDREFIESHDNLRTGPNAGSKFIGNDANNFDPEDLVANMHRMVLKPHAVGVYRKQMRAADYPGYAWSTFWGWSRKHIPVPIRIDRLQNVKVVVHVSKGYHHFDHHGYWGFAPKAMAEPLTNVVRTLTKNVLSQAPNLQRLEVQIRDVNYPDCQGEHHRDKNAWEPVLKPLEELKGLLEVTTAGQMTEEFAKSFATTLKRKTAIQEAAEEGAGEDSTLVGEVSTFVEEGSTIQADDSAILEKGKAV